MIKSELLSKYNFIEHGFFTRNGGVSKGLYNSLNLGSGSKDSPENIKENRNIICKKMGVTVDNLVTLYQTHSNKCVYITNNNKHLKYEADAMVTKEKNIALGILTADCVPILLYETNNEIIAAVHAGWKGAISGIIENTILKMEKLGGNRDSIIASIGPCIGVDSYEVDLKFKEKFISTAENNEIFFRDSKKEGKAFFDIGAFAMERLKNLSIKRIDNIKNDTCAEPEKFFSYRRSCINNEPDYGRQISTICLK